jgi:hypothetical protein
MNLRAAFRIFAALFALVSFSACSIAQKTTPAKVASPIEKIYLEHNPRVLMEGLHPEIEMQIKAMGIPVESFSGPQPAGARHVLSYTANWRWDMAMYLTYFEASLREDGRVIGTTVYDARSGGGRFDKFGPTADKIRPQLQQLLGPVRSAPPPAAAPLGR